MLDPIFKLADIQDFMGALVKRWHLSLILFGSIFGTVLALVINQDYEYQAKAKIIIGESLGQRTLGAAFDNYGNYFREQQEFNTQPFILKSLPVASDIATKLNWVDPEREKAKFDALVSMIRGSLSILRIEESRLFEIQAEHNDPLKAQQIANTAADVFIERNFEKKLNAFKKSISWLSDQLIDLEYKLEESQKELIGFIETERITSFDEQAVLPKPAGPAIESDDSRSMTDRLRTRKIELELELSKLQQRYTEKHPKVVRARDELALTQAKLSSEQKNMKKEGEERETEAIRLKQKEIKYSILKRKVEINKELYNSLIQKMKEIDIASAVNDNNMYVMEYAGLPGSPVRPNKGRSILMGFFVALIFAVGIPSLVDYIDPTLHSVQEVEDFLKLPVLSSIPIFADTANGVHPGRIAAVNSHSLESEAFRILRTNLRFAFPADSGRCLLVTSSGPSEGKSTIATNLAITLAASGLKVCLVDTDLRLPRIHKIFEIKNDKGLTDLLVGEVNNLESVVQSSGVENLSLIPSGGHTPKPAELLETKRMKDTVALLLSKYDRVIFDSPPAGNIIDASIVASYVDGVVFVLQAGRLNKSHIKGAREQLDRVKANISGVVLNKIVHSKKSDYYYYYHKKPDAESAKTDEAAKVQLSAKAAARSRPNT